MTENRIKLTPKQTFAHRKVKSGLYDFILYGGAIRGAKTFFLFIEAFSLLSKYPNTRAIFVRRDLQTIKKNTFPSFDKFLNTGLRQFIRHWNRDTETLTLVNGSQFIFQGENFDQDKELEKFFGMEYNFAFIDEMNEIRQETFYKIIERAGTWFVPGLDKDHQPKPVTVASCNPTKGWVKDLIYTPFETGTLRENWLYIQAKITDNPHVPPGFLEGLKRNLPPLMYRRMVDGDWNAFEVSNAFATQYSNDKHGDKLKYCELQKNKILYLSIDFNINPFALTAWHIWEDHMGHHCYCVDEIEIDQGSILKMAQEIQLRYHHWLPTCFVTGDPMGKRRDIGQVDHASNYEQLQRYLGLSDNQFVLPGAPTHENSRTDVNYVLWHHPDFQISQQCTKTRSDFESVEVDRFGQIKKQNRNDPHQKADHLDTARYLINTFLTDWRLEHQNIILPLIADERHQNNIRDNF